LNSKLGRYAAVSETIRGNEKEREINLHHSRQKGGILNSTVDLFALRLINQVEFEAGKICSSFENYTRKRKRKRNKLASFPPKRRPACRRQGF